ncbi:helix-turn-helix domain-containing protein (plasmid) [Haloferacaceae archaeon DSL9]
MPDSRDTNELIEEFAQNPGTESETLDFKSKEVLDTTSQKRDLVQLLAEMANNRGGSVIIGVRIEERDLRLQGFDVDSEYKQEIAHIIHAYASAHLTELCGSVEILSELQVQSIA